jgi:hypothetical protein
VAVDQVVMAQQVVLVEAVVAVLTTWLKYHLLT